MVAVLAVLLAAVAIDPQVALLSMTLLYMLSGLLPRLPAGAGRRSLLRLGGRIADGHDRPRSGDA